MAFKAAVCPSCAGELQVPDNRDLVKCMYCGSDIIVREVLRTSGTVNIENLLNLAKAAEKSGNHEEAYKYYSKVLENETQNVEAWFGRGTAAGWQSSIKDLRMQEMITCYENAMQYASDDEKNKVMEKLAESTNLIAVECWKGVVAHVLKYGEAGESEDTWQLYEEGTGRVLTALEKAHKYSPRNTLVMKNLIHIYTDLNNVAYKKKLILSNDQKKTLHEFIDMYVAKLRVLDSDYRPPKVSKSWW